LGCCFCGIDLRGKVERGFAGKCTWHVEVDKPVPAGPANLFTFFVVPGMRLTVIPPKVKGKGSGGLTPVSPEVPESSADGFLFGGGFMIDMSALSLDVGTTRVCTVYVTAIFTVDVDHRTSKFNHYHKDSIPYIVNALVCVSAACRPNRYLEEVHVG